MFISETSACDKNHFDKDLMMTDPEETPPSYNTNKRRTHYFSTLISLKKSNKGSVEKEEKQVKSSHIYLYSAFNN